MGEKDEEAAELLKDTAAAEVFVALLQRWEEDGNKVHTRAGMKNADEAANSFRDFVDDRKQLYGVEYMDDYDVKRDLSQQLSEFDDNALVQFFVGAGRALKKQERDENMKNKRVSATPSLADTASLVSYQEAEESDNMNDPPTRGSSRARASSSKRGTARGRGKGGAASKVKAGE